MTSVYQVGIGLYSPKGHISMHAVRKIDKGWGFSNNMSVLILRETKDARALED